MAHAYLALPMKGQHFQVGYQFWRLNPVSKGYYQCPDMTLEYSDGKSSFCSDRTFTRDSLHLVAFDKSSGKVADQAAYMSMLSSQSGLFEVTMMDFVSNEIYRYYQKASLFFCGKGKLSMPNWEYIDEEKTDFGHVCKRASAYYLGRRWNVLYTEEIPVSVGPWLLWGTPGLILYAADECEEFVFEFRYFGLCGHEEKRFAILSEYYETTHCYRRFSGSMKECEQMYNKVQSNPELFDQLTGSISGISGNGSSHKASARYIPLIPSDYWKDK